MSKGRFAYLQLIDEEHNNNRFYRMREEGNVIIVEIGRNGAAPVVQKKPLALWDSIYQKKKAEGYVDTADVHAVSVKAVKGDNYAPIPDDDVRAFFHSIMHYANKELKTQYQVSWEEVTPEMVAKAQNLIKQLDDNKEDISSCRQILLELFAVIPRKMKDVKEHLPNFKGQMNGIITREQELLDVLACKIAQETTKAEVSKEGTILDALSLKVALCTKEEEFQIKRHMGACVNHYKQAFRVINEKTDKRFYNHMKKEGMTEKDIYYLYHGSRNQNYYGLITEGPRLNPNAPITGKMFGQGIYTANQARKSLNYTSLSGSYWAKGTSNQAFLAVYKVCYKNPMHVKHWSREMTRYTGKKIAPYDAVFAHGGADLINDEIIIYNEAQCTLQYIIELQ